MKIAIVATHITYGGGLTHLNKIIEWFGRIAPHRRFIVIGKNGQENMLIPAPPNFEYRFYKTPSLNLFARLFWGKYVLPDIIREIGCDLLFEPGNYGTVEAQCPRVSLIHNIAPFDDKYCRSETPYQKVRLRLLKSATIKNIKSSSGIIFLSNYCRDFFSGYVDRRNIITKSIYHGKPELVGNNDNEILAKYDINGKYILSVSHIYRYKKILEMVKGYLRAKGANPDFPPLYIAGTIYDRSYAERIRKIIAGANGGEYVRFLGTIPEDDLQTLYRNCRAFLFPSTLETCSVILIEALSHGCAIACSNKGVMPEVTGGAALHFDAERINDFAFKIRMMVEDDSLNSFLRSKALERGREFSWEKTARSTLDLFDNVLAKRDKINSRKSEMKTVSS